jgi:hypothetical protein
VQHHEDVTLSGIIEGKVRELGEDDEVFGAVAELHLRLTPTPEAAWRGLWRSDADAPEVIEHRTEATESGFIVLELTGDNDIEADIEAIVEHTIRTNHRWHDLNELARSSADRAVAALGDLSATMAAAEAAATAAENAAAEAAAAAAAAQEAVRAAAAAEMAKAPVPAGSAGAQVLA